MIIALNGADFSANNIGSIHLDRPLDESVKEMMGIVTRFPSEQSNEYAQALNTLYLQLVAKGLLSKIKLLAIPYYASTIQEAGRNLINGDTPYGNFSNAYELNGNNEAVIQHKELKNSTAGGWKIESTPSNKISFFGLLSPNGNTAGHFIIAGRNFFQITNDFIISKIQKETYFQVIENGGSITPASGSGTFGGEMDIPTGAFVASFDEGSFHWMDSRFSTPKEGTSGASTTDNITTITPSIYARFPVTPSENLAYKLIGAGENLNSQETYELYNILNEFNEEISL